MRTIQRKEYITREPGSGGLDFRIIADIMAASGEPMGHSTARNYVHRAMEKLACTFMVLTGVTGDPASIAMNPIFQRKIEELVHEVYIELSTVGDT